MELVLQGLYWKTLLLHLDNVVFMAPTFEQHIQRFEDVFIRLRQAGLKLKPSMCEMLQKIFGHLRRIVSEEGINTDPDTVDAVNSWTKQTHLRELHAFMGTAGYYKQYLDDFAHVAKPVIHLTSKRAEWK